MDKKLQTKLDNSWKMILRQIESLQYEYNYIKGLSNPIIALFGAGSVGHDALKYLQKRNLSARYC